jgi:hypothetical protein
MMKPTKESRMMSIDPGKTSGFAFYTPYPLEWKCQQQKYTLDAFLQVINDFCPDVIVCESFVHTHRDAVDYTPVKFIGLVEWYVERRDILLVLQTPGYGKGYFTNEKLKKLGLYVPGKGHAMDAYRHLLQFRMQSGLLDLGILK